MSQENVEVVQAAWEAFRRRDNQSGLAFYDPSVEIHDHVDGSVYRGLDGVGEWIRNWLSVFGDFDLQVEELIDAGDEVIAVLHEHGRGKLSGAMVERGMVHVWTLRDVKLWRLRSYATKQEALDAVGLRE